MAPRFQNGLILTTRVLISFFFLVSGLTKVLAWTESLGRLAAGIPSVSLLLFVVFAIEILGGLALLLGLFNRVSTLVLFFYLIPVTFTEHLFWNFQGMQQQVQLLEFLKNLSIMGGLLGLFASGPGDYSLDSYLNPQRRAQAPEEGLEQEKDAHRPAA